MALIYDAELTPSKPDLLTDWVPRQTWFAGDADARVRILGSYRFDDPAGEVGIETFLVRFGDGPTLQVGLTYRAGPLGGPDGAAGVEPVTTMQHSVLGERWVYDGPHDPAYVAAVATAVLTGGSEAKLLLSDGSELPSRGAVRGSGGASEGVSEPASLEVSTADGVTACVTPDYTLTVRRLVEPAGGSATGGGAAESSANGGGAAGGSATGGAAAGGGEAGELLLTGTWTGSTDPAELAVLVPRG